MWGFEGCFLFQVSKGGPSCSRAVVTWYALTRTWPSVHGKYLNPRVSPPTGFEASMVLTCVVRLRYHHLRGLHVAFTHNRGVGKIGEENKAARWRRSDSDYSECSAKKGDLKQLCQQGTRASLGTEAVEAKSRSGIADCNSQDQWLSEGLSGLGYG